jgi:hypothetical protein
VDEIIMEIHSPLHISIMHCNNYSVKFIWLSCADGAWALLAGVPIETFTVHIIRRARRRDDAMGPQAETGAASECVGRGGVEEKPYEGFASTGPAFPQSSSYPLAWRPKAHGGAPVGVAGQGSCSRQMRRVRRLTEPFQTDRPFREQGPDHDVRSERQFFAAYAGT